jgi:hypothetical protein
MSSFSIRTNPRIKEQMDKLEVDWAEYIRKTIEQKIVEEKRKHAAQVMDSIRKRTKRGDFNAARSVRQDRHA